jgi:hypothetical protein
MDGLLCALLEYSRGMKLLSNGLLVTMFLASPVVRAEGFNVEDSNLSPLPAALAEAVCKDENFADCTECKPVGKPVDLGRSAYVFTTANDCNWSVSMGPIWVVVTQPEAAVVFFGVGNSLNVGEEVHHGMKAVTIGAGTAGWSRTQRWQFDGKRYFKVAEYNEPAAADKPRKHKKSKQPKKGQK